MPSLPDVVGHDLQVVFIGTAVGRRSAQRRHYYSNPTNSFYRDLHAAGLTESLLRLHHDCELPRHGIGLTDLAKNVVASDDRVLKESDWHRDRLEAVICDTRPRLVCFNGRTAFEAWSRRHLRAYGLQSDSDICGIPVFVVPSTSGRVQADRLFNGRTRLGWFRELRYLLAGIGRPPATEQHDGEGHRGIEGQTADVRARQIAAEIIAKFRKAGSAPYLDGSGHLRFLRQTATEVVFLRRNHNPKEWKLPISALEEAVRCSCAAGRPLQSGECNEICTRRGTPISILLRLVPESRYETWRGR